MNQSPIASARLSPDLLKRMDMFLEEFYSKSIESGTNLAKIDMEQTQVRGMENLVVSTTRFSEIINYIKNQVGKSNKNNKWRQVHGTLLEQLKSIETWAEQEAPDNTAARMEIKLRLAKGWIRQVVAQYLYGTYLREDGR